VSDPIGDLRRELEARLEQVERELEAVEPLARERDRLRAALARAPFAAPRRPAAKPAPTRRAPRGANREAILKLVAERPGVSAREIADVTNIKRTVTYNTLSKLVEQGRLAKTELPGGQTGYRPAPETPETPPAG
jgi:DNA invertase Pin-like site-specific DNA recombinase